MAVSVTSTEAGEGPVTSGFWALTPGSMGVVFGDIGTSPLYAFREAVAGASQGQPVTRVMFIALSRSANDATDYFQVPTGRVVEVGTQVTI